jgi:branched-chain amino acid transport system substrate-binding protein
MRAKLGIALLLVMALFAAACGDDDGGDTASEGTSGDGEAVEAVDVDAALDLGTECEEPSGDPLVIGYAADFSELGGYADGPGSEAAQFMADRINCAGGVGGTPVEIVVQDIQGDADVTQRAAQDLLDQGVHAILGPPFSDFGLPLLQVVNGQVPVLFVASTEPVLPDAELNSFLVPFDDPAQATAAAEFSLDEGWETAVTFSSADAPYFEQNPAVYTEVFEAGGGDVAEDFTYSLEDTDFSTQVNALADMAEPPDVIYTAMLMPLIGTLLGQLEGAGLGDVPVIGADAFDATGVIAAGPDAEGVYYTTHGFPGEGTRMLTFLDAYEEENGEPLETVSFGTLAADAVLIVADAYARAGELDAEAIAEQIKSTEDLELITESVTYAGTNGTPIKPVFIHQIVDGEITLADSFIPENTPEG